MSSKTIQILLVEDNPGDSRLIREMLLSGTQEQVWLEPVALLKTALQQIQSETYDVILLDLSLPDSHGIDTLLQMRAEASDTAIVVLTGIDDEELGIQAVQMGAQDYLPKGDVDSKLLVRSIRYAIERHQIEMAVRKNEEEYRSLIDDVFNTSMVAVLILDRSLRVVWCNEATEVYFGIGREHIVGKDKRKLIDQELKCIFADPDDYSARLLQAYDEGLFTDRFECHVLQDTHRDERWLEHWSQPIREGMYAGGRIEQYTDITDRKILEFTEQEQRKFAEALREISALLTSTLDLNEVMARILNNLGRVVPHDSASITLLEDDYIWVGRPKSATKSDTQEIIAEKQFQIEYRNYLDRMYYSRKPLIVADVQEDTQTRAMGSRSKARAFVGAPIQLQNEVIGFVNVFSEQINFFHSNHAERLSAFAELAAIAIQNARLFQQSQELATFKERQRLARELHDSVSQTLFTCRTMAESALRRWDKNPQRAREIMQDVYQLTMTALAEMRILLLELRPAALTQVGLKQLFEQYLQPIQERRRFTLDMAIEDIPPLPPDVQIALYRITQEALNNIDKHAQASRVEIRGRSHQNRIELEIVDDGGGFVVEDVATTSLGLGIMRERAAEIEASIQIESQVGAGTRILVGWDKKESE